METVITVLAVGVGYLFGFFTRPLIDRARGTGYAVQDKLDGPNR